MFEVLLVKYMVVQKWNSYLLIDDIYCFFCCVQVVEDVYKRELIGTK